MRKQEKIDILGMIKVQEFQVEYLEKIISKEKEILKKGTNNKDKLSWQDKRDRCIASLESARSCINEGIKELQDVVVNN